MTRWNDRVIRDALYRTCIEKWGAKNRLLKAAEEGGEMSAAFTRLVLAPAGHSPEENMDNALSELVDVHIMLEQALLILGDKRDSKGRTLHQIRAEKLERLKGLLDEKHD